MCAGWRFGHGSIDLNSDGALPRQLEHPGRPWDRSHSLRTQVGSRPARTTPTARSTFGRRRTENCAEVPRRRRGKRLHWRFRSILALGSRFGRRVDSAWRTSDLTLVDERKVTRARSLPCLLADGRCLPSGSDDGTVRLWSVDLLGFALSCAASRRSMQGWSHARGYDRFRRLRARTRRSARYRPTARCATLSSLF